ISGRIGTRRRKDPPAHPSRFRPSPSIAAVTSTAEDLRDVRPRRQQISLALAVLATVPALVIRFSGGSVDHPIEALIYGGAIVGAAFLLSWAAEAAQLDISAGLAIAVLAFIAVLPEYAVDLVFALRGGHAHSIYGPVCQSAADKLAGNDSPCALALANMTGSNRLLIGLGWTLVVFVAWRRYRRRGVEVDGVSLER